MDLLYLQGRGKEILHPIVHVLNLSMSFLNMHGRGCLCFSLLVVSQRQRRGLFRWFSNPQTRLIFLLPCRLSHSGNAVHVTPWPSMSPSVVEKFPVSDSTTFTITAAVDLNRLDVWGAMGNVSVIFDPNIVYNPLEPFERNLPLTYWWRYCSGRLQPAS